MSVATALCAPAVLAELEFLDRPALAQRWTAAFGSAVPRNAQVALFQTQRDETVATFTLAQTLGLLRPQVLGFAEVAANDSGDTAPVP